MAIRELLPDNIVMMAHLEALPEAEGGAQDMPQQRKVLSLLTWVASFVMCVANMAEKHLVKVRSSWHICTC